jgi:hypothetical protein
MAALALATVAEVDNARRRFEQAAVQLEADDVDLALSRLCYLELRDRVVLDNAVRPR